MKNNKKQILTLALASLGCSSLWARHIVVADFENYNIGDRIEMFSLYNDVDPSKSYAVVEKDPTNPNNKVLHVVIGQWNTYVPFMLPEELCGATFNDQEDYFSFRLYRSNNDQNDYKKFVACLGNDNVYESDSYPHQGDKGKWQIRKYDLKDAPASGKSSQFSLGLHSDFSDYYLDDIVLGGIHDFDHVANNDTLDAYKASTSSAYITFDDPIRIPEGKELSIILSRYSYFNSNIQGEGRLNILSAGDRAYLGSKENKTDPNWASFSGDVHIYPCTTKNSGAGFYGIIFGARGKSFSADQISESIGDGKATTCMVNNHVVLHKGAVMASDGSSAGIRIAHLDTELGSTLYGYMKSSDGKQSYYMLGNDDSDATLAGQIMPMNGNLKMPLGILKEGQGTLHITGNQNQISDAIRVLEGRVLIENDVNEAESKRLTGATGTPSDINKPGIIVRESGIIGGTGSIAAVTDLYGSLQVGSDGIGTLRLRDYAKNQPVNLRLRPTSKLFFEIKNADEHDLLEVSGKLDYYNQTQSFTTSEAMPRIYIQLTDDAQLDVDDEITLITAKGLHSLNDVKWSFDIRYPKQYSWEVVEQSTDEGVKIIARVTSLDYNGQGDIVDQDEDKTQNSGLGDESWDEIREKKDPNSLRHYAEMAGKHIGVAVPTWRIPLDNPSDAKTRTLAEQFNAFVCENEMKFDATEPSRGEFSFSAGDALVNFAVQHNCRIRGHALAWHQQTPTWLTSDGSKNSNNLSRTELLSILKNHITNVVGHWKGKVNEWDVANEVLLDDQPNVASIPGSYAMRPSVWYSGIGENFLDSAFTWARQADPDALLILNDYSVEHQGWAKAEAFYNLVKKLVERKVPIDGVGLQCHFNAGGVNIAQIENTFKRFRDLGLRCQITELDLGISDPTDPEQLRMQANDFYKIAQLTMRYDNCDDLMIWGLTDDMSWRSGSFPLLYNAKLETKPAYYATHAALRQAAERATDIEEIVQEEAGIEQHSNSQTGTYDMMGQRVISTMTGHIYLRNGKKFIVK